MSQKHFSKAPNISIPRSKFDMSYGITTSFLHGDLVPLDAIEVLPGDTFNCSLGSLIRMSTPVAPIMGNIHCMIHAFFVPLRLLWEHAEEFYGANKTSAGPQSTVYTIPQRSLYGSNGKIHGPSHYLGKPVVGSDSTKANAGLGMVSVLKERGYYYIWSEYYRAEQLQNPFIMNKSDSGVIGSIDGTYRSFGDDCMKVCKMFDYFTSATMSPQFGSAVTLPLGSFAPIVLSDTQNSPGVVDSSGNLLGPGAVSMKTSGALSLLNFGVIDSSNQFTPGYYDPNGTLTADLENATAAKVNDIRYAFQLQKYLERSNFGGNRFFEILNVHYGVTSPDSRLQRPEYLGGCSFNINVNQVTQTTGWASGVTSQLGNVGAISVTGNKSHLFNKGFVEPGYVYLMLETKHERSYSQGLMREDTKTSRFEFYSPEFANLGDQSILKKEIYLNGDQYDEDVFGYQEHWAEYRYRPNRVSGLLDPNVTGSLDYWTLGEKFTSRPSFDSSFIVENRDDITRCLASGSTGPDYIGDFWIDLKVIREMPLYSIPGLIDHFGAM